MTLYLNSEQATLDFAAACAPVFAEGGLVFLEGTLGAGKTTFSRGLIRALGHDGAVKSPTYTLVEEYPLATATVCHFDLYRLGDAEELEFMGIREYLQQQALCLVEWADKGHGVLPAADLVLSLTDAGQGRQLSWQAGTERGRRWATALDQLAATWEQA